MTFALIDKPAILHEAMYFDVARIYLKWRAR